MLPCQTIPPAIPSPTPSSRTTYSVGVRLRVAYVIFIKMCSLPCYCCVRFSKTSLITPRCEDDQSEGRVASIAPYMYAERTFLRPSHRCWTARSLSMRFCCHARSILNESFPLSWHRNAFFHTHINTHTHVYYAYILHRFCLVLAISWHYLSLFS